MCTLHTRTYHSAHAARAAAGICVCTHMRASPATTEPPPPAGDALRFECGEKKIGGLPRNAQNRARGGLFFYLLTLARRDTQTGLVGGRRRACPACRPALRDASRQCPAISGTPG